MVLLTQPFEFGDYRYEPPCPGFELGDHSQKKPDALGLPPLRSSYLLSLLILGHVLISMSILLFSTMEDLDKKIKNVDFSGLSLSFGL